MCSIFGIIGEYNDRSARDALAKMSHRGPDYCGVVQDVNLKLGNRYFPHLLELCIHSPTYYQIL